MKILAFDTSNGLCSVAISEGENLLYFKKESSHNNQAECLIPFIEEGLKKLSLNYSNLDYLAVTTGPGSFTGIRIGLAAAKGILLCTKIKPVAVPVFELINFRIKQQVFKYDYAFTAINAYRGEIYLSIYDKFGNELCCQLTDSEDLINIINSYKGLKVLAGSGFDTIYNVQQPPKNDIIILPRFPFPDSKILSKVCHKIILRNKIDEKLEPKYIRLPDAKVSLKSL